MANRLRLLHTSPVHVARFDRIRDRIAPDLLLDHLVREDWLDRARRSGIDDILKGEIAAEIGAHTLCTCSTLGPIAEELGAHRIDRPMMRAAAQSGGRICLVLCLASTVSASLSLLEQEIGTGPARAEVLLIETAWPYFESGDMDRFAEIIADAIAARLADAPDIGAIVLGQASMDVALSRVAKFGIPVLTPAEAAFREMLA